LAFGLKSLFFGQIKYLAKQPVHGKVTEIFFYPYYSPLKTPLTPPDPKGDGRELWLDALFLRLFQKVFSAAAPFLAIVRLF
jgi:hypothetical protein